MSTDEQKQFTPWRTFKGGKRFSDHNAILLNIDQFVKPHGISMTSLGGESSRVWLTETVL